MLILAGAHAAPVHAGEASPLPQPSPAVDTFESDACNDDCKEEAQA